MDFIEQRLLRRSIFPRISEISSILSPNPVFCCCCCFAITVSILRELMIVSAAIAGLCFFFLQFLLCFLSHLPFFYSICSVSISLSCLFLLEEKALQLCSNHNFGHLWAELMSCLILERGPS